MAKPLRRADVRLGHFGRPPSIVTELVGRSEAIARVHELVKRATMVDGGVLMTAERGTAVEAIAREIHDGSRHAHGPCVTVECIPDDPAALDRLLFGEAPGDRAPGI